MLAPGWGTGTRGGSPPGVKLGSLPVDVVGTSEPQILAPSSAPRSVAPTSKPWILAPSMDSKPTANFPLLRLLSCIISENILRSRQALDSAFSVFGFDVRKAKFQTDPWQCLQRVWIWSSEHRGKCSFLLVKILGNGSNSRALCKTVTLKWGLLLPAITEVYCIEHGYDCQITLISWALNCDCASSWFLATNSESDIILATTFTRSNHERMSYGQKLSHH